MVFGFRHPYGMGRWASAAGVGFMDSRRRLGARRRMAVLASRRHLVNPVRCRFLGLMVLACRGRPIASALPILCCYGKLQQAGTRTLLGDIIVSRAVGAGLNDLSRAGSRVNKAVSRVVASVGPRRRIDNRDSGPIVIA